MTANSLSTASDPRKSQRSRREAKFGRTPTASHSLADLVVRTLADHRPTAHGPKRPSLRGGVKPLGDSLLTRHGGVGKTGPWKRTIVYGKKHPHEFPAHHTDVMQQWVHYRVPPRMYDELGAYDGRVVPDAKPSSMSTHQ